MATTTFSNISVGVLDDTTTFPRVILTINGNNVPVSAAKVNAVNPNQKGIYVKCDNFYYFIPESYILTLNGTTNQTVTLTYTEPNSSPITVTSTSSDQTFTILDGTTWTATVAGASGYNPGTLSASSGTITSNTTVSASEATVVAAALVLTNSYYKMSDIYPSTYQTMTTIPDRLDTSNVTNMDSMFDYCTSLTSIQQLDTSNVTDMQYMFARCTSLPATFPWTIDCSSISNANNMSNMFQNSSVTSVTLKNIDPNIQSSITSQLLKGDNTLNITFTEPIHCTNSYYHMDDIYPSTYQSMQNMPDALDTSEVTSMLSMFSGCYNLQTTRLFDTSNVTDMCAMFANCTSLTTISQYDTSNVYDMSQMFEGCSSLTSIPQLDTNNVENMVSMFADCESLTTIPPLDTSSAVNMSFMFMNCTSLPSEFPWPIDCSRIDDADALQGMFDHTPVTLVTLSHVVERLIPAIELMFEFSVRFINVRME